MHRGAQGFVEFASEEADVKGHVPIYIYDRLDEPARGMLEEHLAYAEGGLARQQMTNYDGKFAPGSMVYFVLKGEEKAATEAADRFMDYIANHAYSVTLAVSLGQIRTLIEEPYSMTHSALPAELKDARGLEPGGIRLSVGLEDWHDIINDLEIALEQI